jgi:predicted nucleotidyltransferase
VLAPLQLARVEAVLDEVAGLDALWIFGSAATGRTHVDSDVDLAALFTTRPTHDALLAAREAIAAIVARDVDLVDVEQASPVLAMQILKHGSLVLERDRGHRVRFVAGLPGRYEDVVIFRRPAERLLRARLGAHGRA